MSLTNARNFLDKQGIVYDIDNVAAGSYHAGAVSKFWPYKLAGMLIYGEVHGIKKLPGRIIIAPMPVLGKICPVKREIIRAYIEEGANLGFWDSVEFYSNHALLVVAQSPWESGMLDYPCGHAATSPEGCTTVGSNTIPPTHP